MCARASLFCPRPSIRQQFCVYCIHKRPTFLRAVASYGQYIHTRTFMRYSRWSFYYYYSAYIYRFSLALLLLLYDDVVVRGGDKGETENLTDLGFYVYHEGLYRYVFFFYTHCTTLYLHTSSRDWFFPLLSIPSSRVWYSHITYILYVSDVYNTYIWTVNTRVPVRYPLFEFWLRHQHLCKYTYSIVHPCDYSVM